MNAFVTHIGSWTFAYGLLFLALGAFLSKIAFLLKISGPFRVSLVLTFFGVAFILMKDIPGTLLTLSFYGLLTVSPLKKRLGI